MMANPGANQSGFPYVGTPVTNLDGTLSQPWYYILSQLWQKLGGSNSTTTGAVYFLQTVHPPTPGYKTLDCYDAQTNELLGTLTLT